MKNDTYHEKEKKENIVKLRNLLSTLPDFAKDFFRGIENRTSSRTRIAYAYDLNIFFSFLYETNPYFKDKPMKTLPISVLDMLNATDLEEYLEYLSLYVRDGREHTNTERGKMRKLATIKSFYKYFYNKESIQTNPATLVSMPKIHQKDIIRLDYDEVALLLDEVEAGEKLTSSQQKYHDKNKLRDLALITLLLGTGIRVSECVGLDIQDVDFKNNGIRIIRKGGNESVVYFGDEVYEALALYIEQRCKMNPLAGHENALFLSLQNKRLGVRSVENLVKKYTKAVTPIKKITPHKLRSTYGTSLYKETGDIYLVADVLGHKDVNTTKKHYAAIDEDRRRYAAKQVRLRE